MAHDDTTQRTIADAAARGHGEKRQYVQRMFSDIAPSYDRLNHLLSLNIDRMWRSRAIKELRVDLNPSGTYLDVCAGTLDVSAQLARVPGFRGYVVGADFAEPMLRSGNGKTARSVVGPVTADALELPLADSSVAGAIVAFGIRNVADLDAGLREIFRVVQSGGRFVILEFTTPHNRVLRTLYETYFHHVLPKIGGVVSGHRTAYSYLPKSVANFPREDELAVRMRAAGFLDVHWRTLTFGIAAIHIGIKA
jgi:demethylmenaquinone methyltransferase/2-methoxy-6-polyprenyl-1,4-benzoquinol methylase